MTYEKLQEKVSKLLDDTEATMSGLIEEYNESIEDNEDESERLPVRTTPQCFTPSKLVYP